MRAAHRADAAGRQFGETFGGGEPARKPDSGNTDTARPASTVAATAALC